jgi:Zn-dependent protease
MGLLNLLIQDPLTFVLLAIPLLYSIIIHELAHGWVASLIGDPTAKAMGRLTLNPLKHLDPIGTAMLFTFGFGWAKPVPVNLGLVRNARLGLPRGSSPTCCSPFWPSCCFACSLHRLPDRSGCCSTIWRRSTSCSPRST